MSFTGKKLIDKSGSDYLILANSDDYILVAGYRDVKCVVWSEGYCEADSTWNEELPIPDWISLGGMDYEVTKDGDIKLI